VPFHPIQAPAFRGPSGGLRAAWVVAFLSATWGITLQAQVPQQSTLPATQTRPQDTAQAALKAGNPQGALDIAETALKTFPHDAQLRFIRAVALNQLNRLPEAEAAFFEMTQEFPELPEPYNNLAVVRAAQGKLDQARVALEDALRAVPDYAVAYENLGDVYVQLAARSYRSAQKLDPANKSVGPKLNLVNEVVAQGPQGQAPPASPRPPTRKGR
jgi:Flp pilus assembly protein TadD